MPIAIGWDTYQADCRYLKVILQSKGCYSHGTRPQRQERAGRQSMLCQGFSAQVRREGVAGPPPSDPPCTSRR